MRVNIFRARLSTFRHEHSSCCSTTMFFVLCDLERALVDDMTDIKRALKYTKVKTIPAVLGE